MRVFLVTGHDANASRKTGFHYWTEILAKRGVEVDFMTVGMSLATSFKKNSRRFGGPYNRWMPLVPNAQRFTWRPVFHPFALKPGLDKLTWPIFSLYPRLLPEAVKARLREADIVVVESGVGLTLVKQFARIAKRAKLIYTVSDRLETLSFHPLVLAAEREAVPYFDMIRVPAMAMKADFPATAPVTYIAQGLDKTAFDQPHENPYGQDRNAISIGDMLFNAPVIETLARQFPDWTFHLFGKGARLPQPLPNVVEHGEQPFARLLPYLKFADIGIAPYREAPGVDYISQSSLKMIQYTYCRLPIVAPAFAAAGREHVMPFATDADPASVSEAFRRAIAFDRQSIDRSNVLSWSDVTDRIFTLDTAPCAAAATDSNLHGGQRLAASE
ncbi:GumK N-terminal domain-containing glycosyltransferase [Stutzerimonas tarimensis]|uniref:Glucuronosyltransferase GumK N-terminal domain-containing protein n=1 Tax=Stutzerimonas tarimensis TaxID=1507735 RepID=A0ABV7T6M5_9GAMM